ncbi:hypothetical protein ACLOJK_034725 [Asimina triloba]
MVAGRRRLLCVVSVAAPSVGEDEFDSGRAAVGSCGDAGWGGRGDELLANADGWADGALVGDGRRWMETLVWLISPRKTMADARRRDHGCR